MRRGQPGIRQLSKNEWRWPRLLERAFARRLRQFRPLKASLIEHSRIHFRNAEP